MFAAEMLRKSSSVSLDCKDLFLILIIFICENTLSTTPMDTGRENNSSIRSRTLTKVQNLVNETASTKHFYSLL